MIHVDEADFDGAENEGTESGRKRGARRLRAKDAPPPRRKGALRFRFADMRAAQRDDGTASLYDFNTGTVRTRKLSTSSLTSLPLPHARSSSSSSSTSSDEEEEVAEITQEKKEEGGMCFGMK